MILRTEDKKLAIQLRIRGGTYNEIREIIPNLSKSTLSYWLANFKLSIKQRRVLEKHIKQKSYDARVKSAWTKKIKKQDKINRIILEAKEEYQLLKKNPLFLVGLSLYWAEGARKISYPNFQFTNSDPEMVKIMIKWIIEICKIPKSKIKMRVYIHKVYANEKCEEFWSKVSGIPMKMMKKTIYKPTPHKSKKNPDYKGCIQLRVFKTEFFWRVIGWIQNLSKEFC